MPGTQHQTGSTVLFSDRYVTIKLIRNGVSRVIAVSSKILFYNCSKINQYKLQWCCCRKLVFKGLLWFLLLIRCVFETSLLRSSGMKVKVRRWVNVDVISKCFTQRICISSMNTEFLLNYKCIYIKNVQASLQMDIPKNSQT